MVYSAVRFERNIMFALEDSLTNPAFTELPNRSSTSIAQDGPPQHQNRIVQIQSQPSKHPLQTHIYTLHLHSYPHTHTHTYIHQPLRSQRSSSRSAFIDFSRDSFEEKYDYQKFIDFSKYIFPLTFLSSFRVPDRISGFITLYSL